MKAYNVKTFCDAYGIKESFFYHMIKTDRAPDLLRVGKKILIPLDAAEVWEGRFRENFNNTEFNNDENVVV